MRIIAAAQVGLLFLLVSPCPVMGQKPQDGKLLEIRFYPVSTTSFVR